MEALLEKLGARIRYFRMIARLSQGELARRAQLTNGYLSDVERGKVNISITNLNQVAMALGVPLAVLLDCDSEGDTEKTLAALNENLPKMPQDALQALFRLVLMLTRQYSGEPGSTKR